MQVRVVAFLDGVPIDAEFAADEEPLHVPLVPPCDTDAELAHLEVAVESALAAFGPIGVSGGDDDLVTGREVTLLEDDGSLGALHRELLGQLRPLGLRMCEPGAPIGSAFRPHVTVRDEERIERGERLTLDAVALLVRAGGAWRLVAQFPLL